MKKSILFAAIAVGIIALFSACSKPKEEPKSETALLSLSLNGITTRAGALFADESLISRVRIYVFNGEYIDAMKLYNANDEAFKNPFSITTSTGSKQVYVVANEPDDMSATLASVKTLTELKAVVTPKKETLLSAPLMMTGNSPTIVQKSTGSSRTQVTVSLVRLATKISLKVIKGAQAESENIPITIKSVKVYNIPSQSSLLPDKEITPASYFQSTKTVEKTLTTAGVEVWSSTDPLYLYENRKSNVSNKDVATYLEIEALYNNVTTTYIAYVNGTDKIKTLPFNTQRNYHYKLTATINGIGKFDGLTLNTEVLPWKVLPSTWKFNWIYEIYPYKEMGAHTFTLNEPSDYVDLDFRLENPVDATWKAHLSNPLDFEFVLSGEFVDGGQEDDTKTYKIRIKPKNPRGDEDRTTEFYITVNGREVPLIKNSSEVGAGNRLVMKQPKLEP